MAVTDIRVGDWVFHYEFKPYYRSFYPPALRNTGLYFVGDMGKATGLDYLFYVEPADGSIPARVHTNLFLNGTLITSSEAGYITGHIDTLTVGGANTLRLEAVDPDASYEVEFTTYPITGSRITGYLSAPRAEVIRVDAEGNPSNIGERLRIKIGQVFSSIKPASTELNTSTIKYRYNVDDGAYGSWVNLTTAKDYNGILSGTFSKEHYYNFQFYAEGVLGGSDGSYTSVNVPTAKIAFHMARGGNGVSVGKYSTQDGFDVAMDSEFENPVQFDTEATFIGDCNILNGSTYKNGDHESSIDESGTYDALRFFPTKGQTSDALWFGKRGGTVTALAPYVNSGVYLGFNNYRFGRVYTDSIGLGGSNPLIASSGNQDVHLDMAEANYGFRYGVTESMWSFYPRTTNTSAIGTPNKKWTKVYATTGTIQTSDKRHKKEIEDLDMDDFILALRPVTYQWKKVGDDKTYTGFIAQEVRDNLIEHGMETDDFAGLEHAVFEDGSDEYGLNYAQFIAPMVHLMQEQERRIVALEKRITELEKGLTDDLK